jgi:hypothetical protein
VTRVGAVGGDGTWAAIIVTESEKGLSPIAFMALTLKIKVLPAVKKLLA